MTRGPFDWVRIEHQGRLLLALTVLLIACTGWLIWAGEALRTAAAPDGIVTFELARTRDIAAAILDSWSPAVRTMAALIQGFDFLYLLVYPAWFALAASRLGAALDGRWSVAGKAVAWGILPAAPLDAAENYALNMQLLAGASAEHAALAFWCAVPKFVLVFGAALFLIVSGTAWILRRLSRPR